MPLLRHVAMFWSVRGESDTCNLEVVFSTLPAFPLARACCDDKNHSTHLRLFDGKSALRKAEQQDRTPSTMKPPYWSWITLCSDCYWRDKYIYIFFFIFKDFKLISLPSVGLEPTTPGSSVVCSTDEPTTSPYVFVQLLLFESSLAAMPIS